jgi:omega-hydroxy-beta-dihydromenaquinone-9 sulfotransferase
MNIRYRIQDYINLTTHTALGISLHRWVQLLWKNRFNVEITAIPKLLFITGNAVLNVPLHVWEYLRFNKKIKSAKVEPPVFILGHPRSGTTFLQYVLSQDPNFAFCSTSEGLMPNIFLTADVFTKRILESAMPATRPQDNVKAGASLPIEEEFAMGNMSNASWVHGLYFPRNIYKWFNSYVTFSEGSITIKQHWKTKFHFLLQKLSYRYQGKRLMLKSPANTGRLKELYELYPQAKFIHIHRDPFSVYVSTERLYEKILPLIGFQKVGNEFMQEHILYAYEQMYRKYLLDRDGIPASQIIEFSYDRFISSPEQVLREIYNHLALGSFEDVLPFFKTELQRNQDYKTNAYQKIDDVLKQKIMHRWKFAFDAFGYDIN